MIRFQFADERNGVFQFIVAALQLYLDCFTGVARPERKAEIRLRTNGSIIDGDNAIAFSESGTAGG